MQSVSRINPSSFLCCPVTAKVPRILSLKDPYFFPLRSLTLLCSSPPNGFRTFTSSPPSLKTGGIQHAKSNIARASAKASAIPEDPFDFTDYEASIEKIHERLKSDLSKIKAGGRDPEAIENIRLNVKSGVAGQPNTQAKIGDLASVMQRGRNIVIMVAEKEVCIVLSPTAIIYLLELFS